MTGFSVSKPALLSENQLQHAICRAKLTFPVSVSSGLIPSDPVFGGAKQGQNRDKFWFSLWVGWAVCGLLIIGMTIDVGPRDDILRSAKRQKRKPPEDIGLPPDSDLKDFASCYLDYASSAWPELKGAGLIPTKTDKVIQQMVEDFKVRHRTGIVTEGALTPHIESKQKLAPIYPRFGSSWHGTMPIRKKLRLPKLKDVVPGAAGSAIILTKRSNRSKKN